MLNVCRTYFESGPELDVVVNNMTSLPWRGVSFDILKPVSFHVCLLD